MSQIIIDIGSAPDDGLGTPLRQAFADINLMFGEVYTAGPVDSTVQISNNVISTTAINSNLILSPSGTGRVQVTNSITPRINDVYDIGSPGLRFNTMYVGTGGLDVLGPLSFPGGISTTGNITANYFFGNGSQLTGIVADSSDEIANGTSGIFAYQNANIAVTVSNVANTVVFAANTTAFAANITVGNNVVVLGNGFVETSEVRTAEPVEIAIQGISRSNPAVVTTQTPHGLPYGQRILIDNVGGMTQVDSQFYYIIPTGATTFALYQSVDPNVDPPEPVQPVNSSAFTAATPNTGVIEIGKDFAITTITNGFNRQWVFSQEGYMIAPGAITAFGNVVAPYFVGNVAGNISGNVTAPGANTQVLFNDQGQIAANSAFTFNKTTSTLSTTGNINASGYLNGNGVAILGVLADRGSDPNNWDALTQMGVYTVNRTSWSGVQGAPLNSTVFVGLLEVKNSTNQTVEQIFYPGTLETPVGNVVVQWNRAYWNNIWSSWIKMVNDGQVVTGGDF
jgi:hypothetical protein